MSFASQLTGEKRRFPRQAPRALLSGHVLALAALLTLAVAAWVMTDVRMSGMDAGPGSDPGGFGFYISTWVVMMAAMMFPSVAPMVLTYRNLRRGRRAQGQAVPVGATAVFVAGYLAVWAASGLLAYVVLKAGRAWDGGLFAWHRAGRWTAAGFLLAAAAYEFTPLKLVCLRRCRAPVGFLLGSWRDGRDGALAMGAEHGAWCLGCCWWLMIALFALGAMSLTWMIVVSALISAEKLLAWRRAATTGVAAILAALAIGVAATPGSVPALTLPGSPAAMHAMQSMSMRSTPMHPSSKPDSTTTIKQADPTTVAKPRVNPAAQLACVAVESDIQTPMPSNGQVGWFQKLHDDIAKLHPYVTADHAAQISQALGDINYVIAAINSEDLATLDVLMPMARTDGQAIGNNCASIIAAPTS